MNDSFPKVSMVRDKDRESENMMANQKIKIYVTFTSKSESSKAGNLFGFPESSQSFTHK